MICCLMLIIAVGQIYDMNLSSQFNETISGYVFDVTCTPITILHQNAPLVANVSGW